MHAMISIKKSDLSYIYTILHTVYIIIDKYYIQISIYTPLSIHYISGSQRVCGLLGTRLHSRR